MKKLRTKSPKSTIIQRITQPFASETKNIPSPKKNSQPFFHGSFLTQEFNFIFFD